MSQHRVPYHDNPNMEGVTAGEINTHGTEERVKCSGVNTESQSRIDGAGTRSGDMTSGTGVVGKGDGVKGLDGAGYEDGVASGDGLRGGYVWKVAVTVTLTLSMISVGMFLEISGPTLPYLKDRLGVNYEEVSRSLVARSVGYFIGSILGGFLCDAFPTIAHINFSVCFLLTAVGTTAAPWCKDLIQLGFMFFLQGVAQGCICTGLNAVVMKMWGDKGSPALVSQHLGFGIGALIAPQLANAFIWTIPSSSSPDLNVTTTVSILTSPGVEVTTSTPSTVKEQIEYSYLIIGVVCALFSVVYMAIFLIERFYRPIKVAASDMRNQEKRPLKDILKLLSPGTCTGGDTVFGTLFFVFLAIFFIHIVGGERAISKFLYSFAVESDHKFSPNSASLINSAFWFTFTAGRAVNTAAAIFVKPPLLLGIVVVGNVLNALVLAIWGSSNTTVLWVFTCSYGFFLSPLFPTALVWANQYVEMTAVGVAVGYVGSAVGGMIYQWLTGYLFQYHGPNTLMYVLIGCAVNLVIIYVVLQVLGNRHGNRFKVRPKPEIKDVSIHSSNLK